MGDWYTIGLALGIGTALGAFFAGLLSSTPLGRIAAVVLAGAAGAIIVVAGALRRGGTRSGLALIVAAVAAGLAGLAFVPGAGYLEAVALPALAARLRRTQADRYAGLRTLARDKKADPDPQRRPDAADARRHARGPHPACARAPRRARALPP